MQVISPANIVTNDGSRLHIPMLNGVVQPQYDSVCKQEADLDLAKSLLLNRPATFSRPKTLDTDTLVPPGHTQADVALAGVDYAQTFELQAYENRDSACPTPTYTPAPTTSPSPGSYGGGSFDGPSPGDQGLPDGLLTGGYCRKHRWC